MKKIRVAVSGTKEGQRVQGEITNVPTNKDGQIAGYAIRRITNMLRKNGVKHINIETYPEKPITTIFYNNGTTKTFIGRKEVSTEDFLKGKVG